MRNVVERFKVQTKDGKILDAVIYERMIDTTTNDDKGFRSMIPGQKEARLADGRPLNRIDRDNYQIVESGERVTRVK